MKYTQIKDRGSDIYETNKQTSKNRMDNRSANCAFGVGAPVFSAWPL